MKRLLSSFGILGLAVVALAYGSFVNVAQNTYRFPVGSDAERAKCLLCHVTKMGGKLNPYGIDLKKVLKGSKSLTPDILHSIDNLESGKHGVKNGELLKAGKMPG